MKIKIQQKVTILKYQVIEIDPLDIDIENWLLNSEMGEEVRDAFGGIPVDYYMENYESFVLEEAEDE